MAGTIGDLARALLAEGTSRRFGRLMLADDPLARRLRGHEEAALEYAVNAGQVAAEAAARQYGRDPDEIAAMLGVPVTRDEEAARAGSAVLLSEYGERPLGITIHMHPLAKLRESIEANDLGGLLGMTDPVPTQLAHELYHHLEAKKLTPGTAGFRRDAFRLGPIGWGTGFPSLSEVAADGFAMSLLGQNLHPKVIHFLIIHQHNPDYVWKLVDQLRALPA